MPIVNRLQRSLAWFGAGLLLVMAGLPAVAQVPSAGEVLARSIAYHDPAGVWFDSAHRIAVREQRPGAEDRETELVFDFPVSLFAMTSLRGGRTVEMRHHASGSCVGLLDGSPEMSEEDRKRYRLDCEGIVWVRDYQEYLYGLPMKLRDPGTLLGDEVVRTTFEGRDVFQLRVTYSADVGADVWYFYFDPSTYAMLGSRFYHDEAANDGEYLIYEGRVEAGGIVLPGVRKWYANADGAFLGEDRIEAFVQVVSGQQ